MREIKYPVIKLLSLITVSLLSCNVDAIEKRIRFDITAQPMNAALIEFSEQSGIQIAVNASHIRNLRCRGITGEFATTDAIEQLLEDTSLTFDVIGDTTIVIKKDTSVGKAKLASGTLNSQPQASVTKPKVVEPRVKEKDDTQLRRFEKISVVGSAIVNQRLESALPVAVYDRKTQ